MIDVRKQDQHKLRSHMTSTHNTICSFLYNFNEDLCSNCLIFLMFMAFVNYALYSNLMELNQKNALSFLFIYSWEATT